MPDVLACSPATWTLFRQFRGIGPVADGGPEALEIQWNFAMSAESAGAPGKPAKSRGCVTYRQLRCNTTKRALVSPFGPPQSRLMPPPFSWTPRVHSFAAHPTIPLRSCGAFFAPGFCIWLRFLHLASLPPNLRGGGAPRVVGCLRGTRWACT